MVAPLLCCVPPQLLRHCFHLVLFLVLLQSSQALAALNGFYMTPESAILVTFAKK
jgi:hypothetical protein